jgi:23S rRNA-/tRNA-specific pseudouridylate synthase
MVTIVHQDEELLVLFKPSGIPTTAADDSECLVDIAQRLDTKAPHLHPMSRLDAQVSGLVTFARTRSAIRQILLARETGKYQRLYLAISGRAPEPPQGIWRSPIAIDPSDPRRRVVVAEESKTQPTQRDAITAYNTITQLENAALLHLRPQTGRTHQLRVHASAAGVPLLGDRHYGGPHRVVRRDGRVIRIKRVMLHCARLVLPDLVNGGELTLRAEPPLDIQELWRDLGGSEEALLNY